MKMGETFYETEFVALTYSKENQLLELKWKKKSNSEEFRNAFNVALEYTKKNKVLLFISDIRNEGIVNITDIHWLETVVFPRIIEINLKRVAIVTDDSMYSNIYAESIKKKAEKLPVSFELFMDHNLAHQWVIKN